MSARVPGVGFAVATAFAMIAFQVGAKATRDALFLSSFPVSALPLMMIASALVSLALALVAARALERSGPDRIVPLGFAASAALFVAEYALVRPWPLGAAVVVYLHYGALGALLVSGFWAFLNERLDPRAAKRTIGRVTAGGTIGGLAGGLLAERVGASFPLATMLPLLALLHLACAWFVIRLRRALPPLPSPDEADAEAETPGPETAAPAAAGARVLGSSGYLRTLVAIVVLVTVSEGLIDWVFKARAAETMTSGADLLRLFAVFYTATALLTIVLQATASRGVLERLGPARTAGLLPIATGLGGLGALVAPGFAGALGLRAIESVVSNSLFRAGYEILFTPVPAREKRAAKPVIDVGASRVGDLLGAAMIQVAVVTLGLAYAPAAVLALSVVASIIAASVAMRLHAGYLQTLERGLVARAVHVDLATVQDAMTRSMVLQNLGSLRSSVLLAPVRPADRRATPREVAPAAPARGDGATDEPWAARAAALCSGRRDDVRRALAESTLPEALLPRAIALLAWDEVAREAIAALQHAGPPAAGALVAALCDADTEFAIRRRIPLVLGTMPEPEVVAGLMRGLEDRRFEVRYRCGRALHRLVDERPELAVPPDAVFAAVLREVSSERRVWDTQRILDRWDDDTWLPLADDALRSRANRSLEHVFTLLALALPRQPLQTAFRGLATRDPVLRGTSLEYLETLLPPEVRGPLWPYLEDDRPKDHARRSPEEALAELLRSGESIRIRLDELRAIDAIEGPGDDA